MSAIGLRGHQVRNTNHEATQTASPATVDAQNAARVNISSSPQQPTSYLQVRNTDAAVVIRIYWTAADLSADQNYITVDPGSEYEGPAEVKEFWVRTTSAATADIEAVFYFRRG